MYILSFDVTSNNISIVIFRGDVILSQIDQKNNSNQSEFLTILLEESLRKAKLDYYDLDLVAFTNGPASFTSVRIGYIAAKMINLCCKIPITAISSNMAVASDYLNSKYSKIITVLDARLGDVFLQIFNLENQLSYDSDFKSIYLVLAVLACVTFYVFLSIFIKAFQTDDIKLKY